MTIDIQKNFENKIYQNLLKINNLKNLTAINKLNA